MTIELGYPAAVCAADSGAQEGGGDLLVCTPTQSFLFMMEAVSVNQTFFLMIPHDLFEVTDSPYP